MKQFFTLGILLPLLFIGARPVDEFPQAEISNGIIHARLYLPDGKNGYYRGSRFDWSGVIPALEYKGHSYFGQWFQKYSPTLHDAIMGPVEDFSPVDYEKAKTGDTFLKIGIGMLTKPEEPAYSIVTPYVIANPGTWKIKKKSNQAEFIHTLADKEYGYEYHKTVQLTKNKAEMVLTHIFKNTGKRAIETNVYDHNFFVLDQQPTGKDVVIKFPYPLSGEAPGTEALGKLENDRIVFLKELTGNEHLYYRDLQGYTKNAKDYDIRIENHKTGAAVRITSDQPLSKLVFWSAAKTVCPEPYIQVNVKPGESFHWKIIYQFYICDTINQ